MYTIGRHINSITLNPKEYVLDADGQLQLFATAEEALEFMGYLTIEEAEDDGIYIEPDIIETS